MRSWTRDEETTLLAGLAAGQTYRMLAERLNRSVPSVVGRAWVLRHTGRRRAYAWTADDDNAIWTGLEEHRSYAAIARQIGRTEQAVRERAAKLDVSLRNANGYTLNHVARLLGVDSHAVAWWCREGWLRAHPTQRVGRGQERVVEHDDLAAFLADEARWHLLPDPSRIPDDDLRAWTVEQRRGLTFLTTGEVGQLLCLTHYRVNQLIRQGRLRAVKLGPNWLVRSDHVHMPAWSARPKGPRVTDREREMIRRLWGTMTAVELARRLGRRNSTVVHVVARRLGLPPLGRGWHRRRQEVAA